MRRALPALVLVSLLLVVSGCADTRSPADKAVGWFPQSERAMAHCVIHHESNGNPSAVSPSNDHGIFQINAVHAREFERLTGRAFKPNVYDPVLNGQYAYVLWKSTGWRSWAGARRC